MDYKKILEKENKRQLFAKIMVETNEKIENLQKEIKRQQIFQAWLEWRYTSLTGIDEGEAVYEAKFNELIDQIEYNEKCGILTYAESYCQDIMTDYTAADYSMYQDFSIK